MFSKHAAEKAAPASSASATAPSASSAAPAPSTGKRPGAFYQDDGPGDHIPNNLDSIPDAVPRTEPLRAAANKPYSVFGHEYVPMTSLKPYKQRGVASWYGKKFNGAQTSSGEIYDMYAMTAAHPTLPIPSYARVTNLANSKSVIVRVNDRGPFLSERIMDLSYAAAYRLGYVTAGSAKVEVESIDPGRYVPALPAVTASPKSTAPAPAMKAPAAGATAMGAPVVDALVQTAPIAAIAVPPAVPLPAIESPAPSVVATDAPAPLVPVTSEASGVYLQLGAFSQRDNAEAFRTRVHQRLDWLTDTIHVAAGNNLYRVQVGPYRDRVDAERMAARIQEALELKPTYVVK